MDQYPHKSDAPTKIGYKISEWTLQFDLPPTWLTIIDRSVKIEAELCVRLFLSCIKKRSGVEPDRLV